MGRYLIGLVILGLLAVEVPAMLERAHNHNSDTTPQNTAASDNTSPERVASLSQREPAHNPLEGRSVRIKADRRGHFLTNARLNGRSIEVLVDTGATSVAINRSHARRIGINLKNSDFKYKVNTANGQTKAAGIIIDEVSIGRVRATKVRAMVLEDRALDGILLGMSFLNRMKKFEISNGSLLLTQ